MNDQLQQLIQVAKAAAQGDQLSQQAIMQLAQQVGPQQLSAIAQQVAQVDQEAGQILQSVAQSLVASAKFGAKLNYIRQLNGSCPEGYKVEYYKEGGQLCKRCMKVHQEGGEVAPQPKSVMDQFRVESAKCGKKMKKAACGSKVQKDKCGSKVEMDKCGKKMKKKEDGGQIETAKCGGKPRLKKKSCGGPFKK